MAGPPLGYQISKYNSSNRYKISILSIDRWLSASQLINKFKSGKGSAWYALSELIRKGKLTDRELEQLIALKIHPVDAGVLNAPNLRGKNLIDLHLRSSQYDNVGVWRSRLKMGLKNVSLPEVIDILEKGPVEVALSLINTSHRIEMFDWIQKQDSQKRALYIYPMKIYGKREYEEELSYLPLFILEYIADRSFCEFEATSKWNLERALNKAKKEDDRKNPKPRKNPILELESKFLKMIAEEDLRLGTFKSSSRRHYSGYSDVLILVEKSHNISLLIKLTETPDPLIEDAFLKRIKEEEFYRKSGESRRSGLSDYVYDALASAWDEEWQVNLARCKYLPQQTLITLASSQHVRVRSAVARTLGLPQRELRIWLAEQRSPSEANSPQSSKSMNTESASTAPRRRSAAGVVYILMNPSMPGLVKIGHSTRSAQARVAELSDATGIPTPFELVIERRFNNSADAEAQLHVRMQAHRVTSSREFFRCEISDAVEALLALHQEQTAAIDSVSSPKRPVLM